MNDTHRGRVRGKVAFITGAGRGQGRSHALRLAEEGADIIAVDIGASADDLPYLTSTEADLAETAGQVRARGRSVITSLADVRDLDALRDAARAGIDMFGKIDIVCANAAICTAQRWHDVSPGLWEATISTNLSGAWNTAVATIPHLMRGGGGSLVFTGSSAGIKGLPFLAPYVAAKHGLVGLAKSLANELGHANVRVNVVHPAGVATPMVDQVGPAIAALCAAEPHLAPMFQNTLPVESIEPIDVSNAVLYLASDESRFVTGTALVVDAGTTVR